MKKRMIPCLCLVLGAIFAISPMATALAEPQNEYDYSNSKDTVTENKSVSACDLLALLHQSLSDLEKTYLSTHSDTTFLYYNKVPSSSPAVKATLSEQSLLLEAQPYSYTASNGQTVTWYPYRSEGVLFTEGDSSYTATLTDIPQDRDYATLEYRATYTLNEQPINTLLNQTYYAAQAYTAEYEQKTAEYNQSYAAYQQEVAAYQAYVEAQAQYEKDQQAYDTYVADYAAWQEATKTYQTYLAQKEAYDEEYKVYSAYVEEYNAYKQDLAAYNAYCTALKNYQQAYADYFTSEDYLNLQKAKRQLEQLKFITTSVTSYHRVLSASILGDSVTSILKEKDTLVNDLKADQAAVDLANTATNILRSLFTSYLACTTEEEQYAFYVINYDSLVNNLEELLRALEYLYTNNSVRLAIDQQGKTNQYLILIAQLFVLSNALDDNPIGNYQSAHKKYDKTNIKIYDDTWTIGGKTPLQLLENVVYLEDTNDAAPLENGYPVLGELPVEPEEVQKPTEPEKVQEPIAPTPVADPGEAPQEVLCPTAPQVVAPPREEPQPFVPTAEAAPLIAAYQAGELTYREPYTAPVSITLSTEIKKPFRNVQNIELYFYDLDGTFLWETSTEKHSNVAYSGKVPTKERTGYICTFDYWQDAQGNKVDLQEVLVDQSDINLYPHFSETPIQYTIYWVIEGTTQTSQVAYQQTPAYPYDTPVKANEGERKFRFTGWDMPFSPVEGEQTYTAQFEASYLITVCTEEGTSVQSLWAGEWPTLPQSPQKGDDQYYGYTFAGWDNELTAAASDITYTALFTPYLLVPVEDGEEPLAVTVTEQAYLIDATALAESALNIATVLQRAQAAQTGLVCQFSNATVTFNATAVSELVANHIEQLSVSITQPREDAYTYAVYLNGKARAEEGTTFTFTASGTFEAAYIHLYQPATSSETTDNTQTSATTAPSATATSTIAPMQEVPFELNANTITFQAQANTTYTLLTQYSVHVTASPNLTLTADQTLCQSGESVTITYSDLAEGMELKSLSVTDANGNEIPLQNNTFVMPQGEVTISATCALQQFLITFKVNNRTVSSKIYTYGETVTLPPEPVLADDETYSYTFIGWSNGESELISKEVPTVVAETCYVAVFEQEVLPPQEEVGWTKLKIIVTVIKVALVLILLIVLLVVVILIKNHFTKSNKNGRSRRRNRTRW